MEVERESDEETWEEDIPVPNNEIWNEICEKFEFHRLKVEEHKKSKVTDCVDIINPTVRYMNEEVFVILLDILVECLFKAKETNSLLYHKSIFNPMDFIAEYLWNLNPKHPERHDQWVFIFDMDWAKDYLKEHPRPHFPLSYIWDIEHATLKIQSYLRGYWVRKREDVQEMRLFWKALHEEKKELEAVPKAKECVCYDVKEDTYCKY